MKKVTLSELLKMPLGTIALPKGIDKYVQVVQSANSNKTIIWNATRWPVVLNEQNVDAMYEVEARKLTFTELMHSENVGKRFMSSDNQDVKIMEEYEGGKPHNVLHVLRSNICQRASCSTYWMEQTYIEQ